jgi:RNA polymerase subunit RPABC4/transcription elongation factor Spt4
VSWALRTIGSRSSALRDKAIASGKKLAKSSDATERWLGNDVVRDLERSMVAKRVAVKDAKVAKAAAKAKATSSGSKSKKRLAR